MTAVDVFDAVPAAHQQQANPSIRLQLRSISKHRVSHKQHFFE
jgi:hypothetical protein